MKKLLVSLLMICTCTAIYAQQLTVKSVNLRPQDARARTNPRDDAKGKKCAIIRVGVVGVENLVFPDAVGNVERSLSEYVVYVPDGTKSLTYKSKSGEELGSINFDDYGLEINSLTSYDVVFESKDRLRSAIFSIQPANATLTFDGKKVDANSDGIAMINKPVGEYSYTVMADGYLGQSGTVTLTEDDISTVTDIILEQQLYPVTIKVFPEESTVFIDNVPYTKDALSDLKLPGGKHELRITAVNYRDEERTINVSSDISTQYFTLKEAKHVVVKHKEERSRTNISIRNAFYITGGFAFTSASNVGNLFDGKNAFDFGLELSAVQHFGGIFAIREGVSIGAIKSNKNENYIDFAYDIESDSLKWMWRVDVPLQFGVSLPFGSYNEHLFSIFGGGYAKYIGLTDISESEFKFPDGYAKRGDVDDYIFDYGIRLSAKLDFSHFTIGADFSQSLNDLGFSAGVNIGVKLYSLRKKN